MANKKLVKIKISSVLKDEIRTKVISTGEFSNVTDFVKFVVKKRLDESMGYNTK